MCRRGVPMGWPKASKAALAAGVNGEEMMASINGRMRFQMARTVAKSAAAMARWTASLSGGQVGVFIHYCSGPLSVQPDQVDSCDWRHYLRIVIYQLYV